MTFRKFEFDTFGIGKILIIILSLVLGTIGWLPCLCVVFWNLPNLICATIQCKQTIHKKQFPYGRLDTQDYKHYLGLRTFTVLSFKTSAKETKKNLLHTQLGQFPNGKSKTSKRISWEEATLYNFSSDDREWLQREYAFQTALENRQKIWCWIRTNLKGCVPLVGILWILCTETRLKTRPTVGCTVCQYDIEGHWSRCQALKHHLKQI